MRSKTCCSTPISVNECLQVPCLNVSAENVPWGKEEEQQKLWGHCSAHSTSHLLTASICDGGRNLLMLLCATFKAQRPPESSVKYEHFQYTLKGQTCSRTTYGTLLNTA